MKYRFLIASIFMAFTGPLAQAMPVSGIDGDARPMLVRDGCGPGFFMGRDGYCHRERRDWDGDWRPDRRPPPPYYAPPPRYGDDWRNRPRGCPPGFHLGRYSNVCRPNEF